MPKILPTKPKGAKTGEKNIRPHRNPKVTKLKRDGMYAGHKSKNGYARLEVSNYIGLVTSSYLVQHDPFLSLKTAV